MLSRFWDLLERSVIVQSLLPLMFGGTAVYLWCSSRPVPEELLSVLWATVGFWMGTKIEHAVLSRRA